MTIEERIDYILIDTIRLALLCENEKDFFDVRKRMLKYIMNVVNEESKFKIRNMINDRLLFEGEL
jgi:hypothetical protein